MPFVRAMMLSAAVLVSLAVNAACGEPTPVVERLHTTLIEVMKEAQHLNIDARYDKLKPVLEDSFDFERMISAAAGSYWTGADPQDRQRLLDAFVRLSVMTYAARFNGFSGERFETLGERPGPRNTKLVDTRLIRTDADPVSITYVLAESNNNWRIVDVLLDRSISELAVRRSEYNTILRKGGINELAATLDSKAAQIREG
ncbi:MAG: ABC transporter substrate-binding protein [Rhodospirillales bacterium]|nr:ABC transporter substrate-binding protein [Rhodospirillales bacterium]